MEYLHNAQRVAVVLKQEQHEI